MLASRKTKVLFVTLILMFILLPLGTVWAFRPDKTVTEFPFIGEPIAECDDFSILADSDYRVTSTRYYDKDGNVTVIREHWAITNGRLYNSEHPDIWLPEGPDHVTFTIDPDTGIQKIAGLALHLNLPGHGIIALDAGTALLNPDWSVIWERGPHMFFEGQMAPVCDYFAAD